MTTRLTWPGTAAYAAVALIEAIQAIRLIRHEDAWAGSQTWKAAGILVCVALTGLLFVVASITRMPLVGDDTRVFSRRGGLTIIGLAVLTLPIVLLSPYDDLGTWPTWPAIFVPYGVRRLEDAYRQGVEEGRLIANARAAERLDQ